MSVTQFCAIIIAFGLVGLAVPVVQVLLQLKRTLGAAEQTMSDLQTVIPEFRRVAANLDRATERLSEPVEHIAHVTGQLDTMASKVISATDKMAVPFMKIAGVIAGVKSGLNFIRKRQANEAERGK